MSDFPLGLITLIVVSILIYFGLAHRVLDRLYLSDKWALAIIAVIIVGSFIDVPLGNRVTVNLGGSVAIGLAVYVWIKAGSAKEKIRAVAAAAVTALAIYTAGRFMGAEPENMFMDPLLVYPLVAGIVAYVAGRSRRGAFFAAVVGVFAMDIFQFFYLLRTGLRGTVHVGGAGAFDALILSGILAVVLAELIGETRERLQRGTQTEELSEEQAGRFHQSGPAHKPMDNEKEGWRDDYHQKSDSETDGGRNSKENHEKGGEERQQDNE
ncbi:MAG: DUF1614 domain-containing protein [Syntrophomonadaceae bacterium]|jgi:uncharacterized membrane protein|nr:DUF1614 domain-containing protein [Syntrophomonadaceae bacterium]